MSYSKYREYVEKLKKGQANDHEIRFLESIYKELSFGERKHISELINKKKGNKL